MGKFLRIRSFQCCGSQDMSVVPTDPPPPSLHSSLRRHVSSAFTCCACRPRSSSTNSDDDQIPKTPPSLPPLPESQDDAVLQPQRRKKKKSKSKSAMTGLRMSTSSAESGVASSEIEESEETETLICSISNTEGDDSNPESEPKARRKINLKKKKKKKKKRNGGEKWAEGSSPARLSVFQRLIPSCRVEGKIRESFAVVKKSEDPLEDFKRSMMEMITEKEMFERNDLEQLLHCFLSLNDRQFHHIIVQAFSHIWHSLFSNTPTCRSSF